MTGILSSTTVAWMRSALQAEYVEVDGGYVAAGDLLWVVETGPDGMAVGSVKERGDPEVEYIRGLPEYVERWFVWSTSFMTPERRPIDRGLWAPWWTTAPGGPLSLRPASGRGTEVLDGDDVVATFARDWSSIAFTHYGYLPVELLIEQIELPPEESVFQRPRARRGSTARWVRKNRDVPERIRRWALEQLARRADEERRARRAQERER